MSIECPKCKAKRVWFERQGPDVWLRCLCGLMKLVHTDLKTIEDMAEAGRGKKFKISLPREGSRLLMILEALNYYGKATTPDIKLWLESKGFSNTKTEISSYLTLMKPRGLVKILVRGKGVSGGSVWALTDEALHLLNCN